MEAADIACDPRERRSRLVAVLRRRPDVRLCEEWLSVGDYRIQGGVIVERKTMPDLKRSMETGRLFRQIARLKARSSSIRPVLLIEGAAVPPAPWLQGVIASVSVMWYLPVLWSGSAEESADMLIRIGRQRARDCRSTWLAPNRRKPRRQEARLVDMVRRLPGLGTSLARRLLAHFGSIEAICTAPTRELREVSGIGRHRSRAIRSFLRSRYKSDANGG